MQADYLAIFIIGFLSSFGHCIGMCGGFVMAYTMKLNMAPGNLSPSQPIGFWQSFYPHLLYNSGRIITYAFLGLLFGLAGETMKIMLGIKNFQVGIEVFAGLFMIILGLEFGGWIPFNASKYVPGYLFFKNTISRMIGKVNRKNVFALGLALGFIPCGLVYAAGAKAATTGSAIAGLLTMVAFGLGTLPAMLLIGLGASTVSVRFRQKLFRAATILVILLGIFSVYRGVKAFTRNQMIHHHAHVNVSTAINEVPDAIKIYFSLY